MNDAPMIVTSVTGSSTEDDPIFIVNLLNTASDPDISDILGVSNLTLTSGDDRGITIGANSLSVNPNAYTALGSGDLELVAYSYEIADGNGGTVSQSATIAISGVNDAPKGTDDAFTVPMGQTLVGSGLLNNDMDVDDNVLMAVLSASPGQGTVTLNSDGSFIYIPDPSFSGSDSFTYLVNDGLANSGPVTVVIDVLEAGFPVSATADSTDNDDDDIPEEFILPPIVSLPTLGGADDVESKSVPFANVSYSNNRLTVESVTNLELPQSQLDRPNPVWLANASESSAAATFNTDRNLNSNDLLDKHGWFWQALDHNSKQMQSAANLPQILLGSSAAIASTISVGYLIWLIKGGQIVAAMMANVPAWRLIDPLPILNAMIDDEDDGEDGEDDSLDTIINKGEGKLDPSLPLSNELLEARPMRIKR